MSTAEAPPITVLAFGGLAADADVAALGVKVHSIRLLVPTEQPGQDCSCRLPDDGRHKPMVIVGVGPTDDVLAALDGELLAGQVVVDRTHSTQVGHRLRGPGTLAEVVGSLPFMDPTLLTTLTDFTQIALTYPETARHVVTHAVLATSPTAEQLDHAHRAGWVLAEDALHMQDARS